MTESTLPKVTRLQELPYEVRIEEVMTRNVITVTPETSMGELREILRSHRISGAPVVNHEELVGIISIEGLIKALIAGDMKATVEEKMTRSPVTLRSDEPVVQALNSFVQHGVGRFPVVNGEGRLVGILTRGDIIEGLLKKLESEYHEEEIRRYRLSHIFEDMVSDRTSIILRFNVVAKDLRRGGEASSQIKRLLTRLGAPPPIIRRTAIASYEAEMNIIIHATEGGEIRAEVQPGRIILRAVDSGPGIPDIEKAMEPGFSTAPEWIRELGFGAGMGLANIKKCSDEMRLESPDHKYTSLEVVFSLDRKAEGESSRPES
jgi:CBS domain-containing protein/anti-sigma regulatory factor (Ser/Thr protein kinase)